MNNSQYRFTLDLQKHQSQMSIAVYQYDNAVTLNISLTDGGKRYEIKEGSYVIFYGMREDGKPLIHRCELKDNTEIIYNFRNSTAYCCGIVTAQIRLYSADNRLITAPKFNISVEERVVNGGDLDDEALDDETFDILDQIFKAENARVAAEDERNEAEFARNSAEDSRALAESERVDAEIARANAEVQRNQTVADKLAIIQDGDSAFFRYSSYADGTDFTDKWNSGLKYIGIATGQACPTNKSDFVWMLFKGEKGDTGEGFSISKTYTSVAAMNAGFATDGVPLNAFVLIDTGNVEDADNAKLYVKRDTGYSYLTDLSGAQGIKGEQGVPGNTPYIQNGYWYIDGENTGVNAQGNLITTAIPVTITDRASYEQEQTHDPNTLYMFTDDPILDEIAPTVNLTKEGNKTTLSITHKNGTQSVDILDADIDGLIKELDQGTKVVKKATYAQYASEDTSKGTIEERLTALGFKEGSVALKRTPTTTYRNVIKRQGNLVIFDIDVKYDTPYLRLNPTTTFSFELDGLTKTIKAASIGTIPEMFCPNEAMSFAFYLYANYTAGGSVNLINNDRVFIFPNGGVYLQITHEKEIETVRLTTSGGW